MDGDHIDGQRRLDAILRDDFSSFLRKCYFELGAGDELLWNWHLTAIVYALAQVWLGKTKRLVINIPPRSLKSICVSVAAVAWCLGHNPQLKFICASYGQNLADFAGRQCLQIMNSEWYKRIFPETRIDPRKASPSHFETTAGGFRIATSVDGALTGFGADIIIVDDPLKAEEGQSEAARSGTNKWFDSTLSTRLNDKKQGCIILIMQRLHDEDLTGHVLEKGGWVHLRLPAIAETDVQVPVGPEEFHLFRAGAVLHPEREDLVVLCRLKHDMGSANFSAQYLQDPVPAGGALVQREWFRSYNYGPFKESGDQIVISVDTAIKDTPQSSFSVATVWLLRETEGGTVYYLLDLDRRRLGFPDLRNWVLSLFDRWRPCTLLIEDKGSGQGLIQELNRMDRYPIAIKPTEDKVTRFSNQTHVIQQGRVYLPAKADYLEDLFKEMLRFPYGKFDDQVDSISQVLNWNETRFKHQFW